MKIIFLGTNGWYDTDMGNTVSILLRAASFDLVLDAGNGFYKLDRFINPSSKKPLYLFLSHFHLDHIVGLHTLNKFSFPQGLVICGPEGSRKLLTQFVNRPFTAALSALPFPVDILELPASLAQLPFPVETLPLNHPVLTLGYRISLDDRVISYCTDTGYCENAVTLSRSADLLIAECAYRQGQFSDAWPHLNPEAAARIAEEAGARRLALTHFDARLYTKPADREESEAFARKIFPQTFAARDDLEMDL
ncbi:Ribonuclease BN, tRNA processing enzyme [Syntrophus gentianae]|uniref:Ribonuclease BN, tRNA processing enzyme n=1 Tax=Syntrophus gentianae TaxID=43775 RepID=A0A1H7YEQ7_9BACT|nr:ribonuclease Z [Syntrophus gentianae]SEM43807.1 Ribonuclease BN, tRNA processing enzyme [Syntrophus gentianae]